MSHEPHEPTTRLRLEPAPAGLDLVQDLINTRDIGRKVPDLLATPESARAWLAAVIPETIGSADSPGPSWVADLSERDLRSLRSLRSDLQMLVAGDPIPADHTVQATLAISTAGELRLLPAGAGRRSFAAAVWCEVFLAQRAGTLNRLKLCHNPVCGSAFYDRSKNNSGVWHDVKMCGNAANLRASRARKRARKRALASP
jgi:hypothetical protein